MIRIIKGTYGRKVGGAVQAMTRHSPPFSLPAAREAELIALGVAVKVEEPAGASPAGQTMKQLRAVAAERGVDVTGCKSRADILAALAAAAADDDEKQCSGLLTEEG